MCKGYPHTDPGRTLRLSHDGLLPRRPSHREASCFQAPASSVVEWARGCACPHRCCVLSPCLHTNESVCPSGQGGGLKIHCRKLRVGSNPTADIRWAPLHTDRDGSLGWPRSRCEGQRARPICGRLPVIRKRKRCKLVSLRAGVWSRQVPHPPHPTPRPPHHHHVTVAVWAIEEQVS